MKIVSWNCLDRFDENKYNVIKTFNADILVIQECRKIDKDLIMNSYNYDKRHCDWYGDGEEAKDNSGNPNENKNRGIGIFCKEGITIERNENWDKELKNNYDYRYLVPYNVSSENFGAFTLIAVWTKGRLEGVEEDKFEYVEKIHAAIDKYKEIGLLDGRVILIGDFNSNKIWDEDYIYKRKALNYSHSELVSKLIEYGIIDCSKSDKEYDTYYHQGKKKFMIDYCFASKDIAEKSVFDPPPDFNKELPFNVDEKKCWRDISDHVPICVEFTL
jgi:exonuclease III